MLEYLYEIEKLFHDVEALKTTAIIFSLLVVVLFIIVAVQGQHIQNIKNEIYYMQKQINVDDKHGQH